MSFRVLSFQPLCPAHHFRRPTLAFPAAVGSHFRLLTLPRVKLLRVGSSVGFPAVLPQVATSCSPSSPFGPFTLKSLQVVVLKESSSCPLPSLLQVTLLELFSSIHTYLPFKLQALITNCSVFKSWSTSLCLVHISSHKSQVLLA
jgi:hypothetical protein